MGRQVTPEQRAESRAICAAATAPPWDSVGVWNNPGRAVVVHHQTEFRDAMVFSEGSSLSAGGNAREVDADFVAHARTALPATLDALDAADKKDHLSRMRINDLSSDYELLATSYADVCRIRDIYREKAERLESQVKALQKMADLLKTGSAP